MQDSGGRAAPGEQKKLSTTALMNRLFRTSSFESFKARYGGEMGTVTLPEYLDALCKTRGETHESVILRAGLDRVYGHQIFCGRKHPSRDKVIQLAFGFGMNDGEAQELLRTAGKSLLYPRLERDAAILFCLHNSKSFDEAQYMLSETGLPALGGGGGDG